MKEIFKKNRLVRIFFIILISLVLFNIIMGIIDRDICNFFEAPLYAIIELGIIICFVYYLTQINAVKQKKIEKIERIVNKILFVLENNYLYDIKSKDDVLKIRLAHRTIRNKIDLLEEFIEEFQLEEDLKYAKKTLSEYWDLISNHIQDLAYLEASQLELNKSISNLDDCLERIVVKLYKN